MKFYVAWVSQNARWETVIAFAARITNGSMAAFDFSFNKDTKALIGLSRAGEWSLHSPGAHYVPTLDKPTRLLEMHLRKIMEKNLIKEGGSKNNYSWKLLL